MGRRHPRGRHSRQYVEYINSQAWQEKRQEALRAANWCCERCGMPQRSVPLEVHHLTYKRLRHERPSDLKVLCGPCHERADDLRRAGVHRRRGFRLLVRMAFLLLILVSLLAFPHQMTALVRAVLDAIATWTRENFHG